MRDGSSAQSGLEGGRGRAAGLRREERVQNAAQARGEHRSGKELWAAAGDGGTWSWRYSGVRQSSACERGWGLPSGCERAGELRVSVMMESLTWGGALKRDWGQEGWRPESQPLVEES